MEKLLREMFNREFSSSCYDTQQFLYFYNLVKRELKKELVRVYKIKDFSISKGHFHMCGFFTLPSDKHYYFSFPDLRGVSLDRSLLLYRTAKDYKDYTGGSNNYIKFSVDMIEKMKLNYI